MKNFISFILYLLVLASSLQLLMTASSSPIPAGENNGDDPSADDSATTNCHCNSINLMVNGNFLSKWLNPSNAHISIISMTADNLKSSTDNKEVIKTKPI